MKVPALNFDAKEWSELVDVSSMACHEPPCVRNMPIEEIEQMAANGLGPAFPLTGLILVYYIFTKDNEGLLQN